MKQRDQSKLTRDEALALAIDATQLSMKLMQLATSKDEKQRYKNNSNRLLDQAEQIKNAPAWDPDTRELDLIDFSPKKTNDATSKSLATGVITPPRSATRSTPLSYPPGPTVSASAPANKSTPGGEVRETPEQSRTLSQKENVYLWRGSELGGGPFPPWSDKEHGAVDRHAPSQNVFFTDSYNFSLSGYQAALLLKWERAAKALPPPHLRKGMHANFTPMMQSDRSIDLVQDAATDCSVVASMCACVARSEKGFSNLLPQALHPYDGDAKAPCLSPNGKYLVRLNFNGCFRKVTIDDRLPMSTNERLLHVIDRNNPHLLWPALIEKAYLKIRGGYDFPGSNSGTDLWILTGWLPEHVFLHHDETDVDRTWRRMYDGFNYGDNLITIGTGKMSKKAELELDLVAEHDYAVVDLKVDDAGERLMLIKNPWTSGTQRKLPESDASPDMAVVNGHRQVSEGHNKAEDSAEELCNINHANQNRGIHHGTFWMSFRNALQNFESLYLNWNPKLFRHRADLHFEWDLSDLRSPSGSLRMNPQFAVRADADEQIWINLSKYFKDQARSNGLSRSEECFTSLYAFRNEGQRVITTRRALQNSPFVDTPQTLLKLSMRAGETMTIVPAEQGLPALHHTFSLSVWSTGRANLDHARPRYNDSITVQGEWKEGSAGGKTNCQTYCQNPQFSLHLPAASSLSIILETATEGLNVHVKLIHAQGKRFDRELHRRDVVLDSGQYRPRCVVASTSSAYAENHFVTTEVDNEEPTVDKGSYTLVVSTFDPGQLGKFSLTVSSNCNASLNPIARTESSRLLQRLPDVSFTPGVRKVAAPFKVSFESL